MEKKSCSALAHFPKQKADRAERLHLLLKKFYPDAVCALEFENDPFRLLVMARLSAQCTDQRVNEVSKKLFCTYPDVHAFANADLEALEALIRPCGLFRSKALQIRDMSRVLLEQHNGLVPHQKKDLMALPGVGEKIANLMLGDCFSDPHIVADTHCIRLAGRFRLSSHDAPGKVTKDLEKLIPKEEQSDFCHRLITFGREYCRARAPRCAECPFCKEEHHLLVSESSQEKHS